MKKRAEELHTFFEVLYSRYNTSKYLDTDPIIFPKTTSGDIEFTAFISSLFAYGRVPLIQKFLNVFFQEFGNTPSELKETKKNIYYRFQTKNDINMLVTFIKTVYDKHGSINNLFLSYSNELEESIRLFIKCAYDFGIEYNGANGYFFLFPDYNKSALKRLRMFLRWMIRKDDIDFGIWDGFSKIELLYPIDTHILRFSKSIGIIKSESNSYKNATIITDFFKQISPDDPVKYDFAISRLGIAKECLYKKDDSCKICNEYSECPF